MTDRPGIGPLRGESPRLDVSCLGKPQLVEGDRDLGHPAGLVDAARAVPDGIPGEILIALQLAEVGVGLNAQGIHPELESAALVIEKVDHDDDMVILDQGIRGIPVHEMSPDLGGIRIVAAERHIEAAFIECHQELRIHGSGDVIAGKVLEWHGHHDGISPGGLIQDPVHLDGAGRPRRGVTGVVRRPAERVA